MEGPEKGHLVYFIACNNFVKVGYAADVYRRLSQLQTGNPVELKLVMTFGYPDEITARKEERYWREQLVACGKAAHGEWV
ncbi:MAG: GIY-YIG nuclease family protein, partial [Armatimonadia bacterium]